jgi:RNA polymerase sigma-70 factor, ECF subfamily
MSSVYLGGRGDRYSEIRAYAPTVTDADEDLVRRAVSGHEEAFVALVERYHDRLIRFAFTFVHDWATAEDVVQDTWIGVLRSVERFESRSTFRSWLFTVCANRARSTFVGQARVVPVDADGPTVDPARFGPAQNWIAPPESWDDVDARLDALQLIPVVRDAIDQLPDLQRQVVTLRDVEGLTGKEACAVLDISDANLRVLLHRGRARVRQAVEDRVRKAGS